MEPLRPRQFEISRAEAAAAGTFGRKVERAAHAAVFQKAHRRAAVRTEQVVVVQATSAALGWRASCPQRHLGLLVADRPRALPLFNAWVEGRHGVSCHRS
jgi:hypothetical protein